MTARSIDKARKLADQYNRQAAQIAALQDRLYELTQKHRATYAAAMDALPDGASMIHGGPGLEVAGEPADSVST